MFDYADQPHVWSDQRTIRCQSLTPGDRICNSGFSILSPDHLEEEIARLRNHNGVPGTKFGFAPQFSWQRPTGRLHEPQFFSAGINEFEAFLHKARQRVPQKTEDQRAVLGELELPIEGEIERLRLVGEEWFGFRSDKKRRAARSPA